MKKKGGNVVIEGIIRKFGSKGEKTGWTYFEIPADVAEKLLPGKRTSFRVKGFLDEIPVKQLALIPMGDGAFIIPLKAALRKSLRKQAGAKLKAQLQADTSAYKLDPDFVECLDDDREAREWFNSLPPSHRNYYSKWIQEAKTAPTKASRIALALDALSKHLDFGTMLRLRAGKPPR